MASRGATEVEVIDTIHSMARQPALQNKMQTRNTFNYDQPSPKNQKIYASKTVHVVFAVDENAITVVTVLVYYGA
jgi:hypothetical protein